MVDLKRLKNLLDYNPETGVFSWKVFRRWNALSGGIAGHRAKNGYITIHIGGIVYKAHRLAWLYHYGVEPSGHIDHINLVRDDNRISNLRIATPSQNKMNGKVQADNRLGVKGVRKRRNGRYSARITINGNLVYIGTFDTAEEAHSAYCDMAKKHFGAFANYG